MRYNIDMDMLSFISSDYRYCVSLPVPQLNNALSFCKKSQGKETGGIITGAYNESLNDARIVSLKEGPKDSKAGNTWYVRGVDGVQNFLRKIWLKEKKYYLGEWHFHPFGSATPSNTDIEQMKKISKSSDANCSEPLLLIIGGDPCNKYELNVYVFPKNKKFIKLTKNY